MMSGMLAAATSYSRLVCVAEVPKPGAGANRGANSILSSIDFDSAEQLFATAGAVPDIRIYDYDAVLGSPCKAEVAPLCTIATTAKLSCLGYSPHQRPHLLASDYEGVITQWDTARCAAVQEYESQERRVWSVDWAPHQEGQFASGSDDGHVRLWSVRQAGSVLSLDIKANVCCVKYNPVAPHQLAVGCAAHAVLLFDLRAPAQPLHVLRGHSKAVSYTQYLAAGELISASTDSSLRLWDLSSGACVRSYRGHTNEKNFAGLSVDRHFIACGSETNEVFVYYRAFNKPIMSYKVPPDTASDAAAGGGGGGGSGLFISSVRWKKGSNTLLAANSTGNIHILTMMA